MKILEMKNDKIKFNSKKENEVLIDVFLRKSFDELTRLWSVLDFDEMKNDKNWRKYIECKLKVLMWVNDGSCFDEELEKFYKKNILDEFLEEKWFNKIDEKENINLKNYFWTKQSKYENNINFELEPIKKQESLEKLKFNYFPNWFFFSFWNSPTEPTIKIKHLYVLKYRFPFKTEITLEINEIQVSDVIQIKFNLAQDISSQEKEKSLLQSVSNFLLSKVDLTQDIQEIKINQKIEDFSDEFNKMFDND